MAGEYIDLRTQVITKRDSMYGHTTSGSFTSFSVPTASVRTNNEEYPVLTVGYTDGTSTRDKSILVFNNKSVIKPVPTVVGEEYVLRYEARSYTDNRGYFAESTKSSAPDVIPSFSNEWQTIEQRFVSTQSTFDFVINYLDPYMEYNSIYLLSFRNIEFIPASEMDTVVTETRTEPIPYETETRDTDQLAEGDTNVIQEGVDGEYTITEEVTYTNDEETDRVELSRETTLEPVTEIIEVGTGIITQGTETRKESVPHETEYRDSDKLAKDEEAIFQRGVDGERTITEEVTYKDGIETGRQETSSNVTREPVTEIIEVGTGIITTGTETGTEPIRYVTEYQEDAELPEGQSRVAREGVNGEHTIEYTVTYRDGVEIGREEIGRTVTKEPVSKIIEEGTRVLDIKRLRLDVVQVFLTDIDGNRTQVSLNDYGLKLYRDGFHKEWKDYYDKYLGYLTDASGEGPVVLKIDDENYTFNPNLATQFTNYSDGVFSLNPDGSMSNNGSMVRNGVSWQLQLSIEIIDKDAVPKEKIEVTAPAPFRRMNTVIIPEVTGVEYVDIMAADEVLEPGEHEISTMSVIAPRIIEVEQAQYNLTNPYDKWPYTYFETIIPEAPEEFERRIVIPVSSDVEYFDGRTGEVYPGGSERLIGDELIINSRLIRDDAFLTNEKATWTYERTGGVTALNPEISGNSRAKFPVSSRVEYIDKLTGEVLKHNANDSPNSPGSAYFSLSGHSTPTGLLTIVPRAVGDNFLNNPYAEWTMGYFSRGLEVYGQLDPMDEPGLITIEENFKDYMDIFINGELLEDYQSPGISGQMEVIVKFKKSGKDRLDVDWERGEQGEPIGNDLVVTREHRTDWIRQEWIEDDAIRWTFNWDDRTRHVSIRPKLVEQDESSFPGHRLQVSAVLGYKQQIELSTGTLDHSIQLAAKEYDNYFEIQVNGRKLTNFSESIGNVTYEADMTWGYKEIRLRLTNPDMVWKDFLGARGTMLYLGFGGPEDMKNFETEVNGDLVWKGIWPKDEPRALLLVFPYLPEVVVNQLLPKLDPHYDEVNKIVTIPQHPVIEFVDRDTLEVYPPGPHQITRYTEIYDRINWDRRLEKINGRYYLYEIKDDHRYWFYHYTEYDTRIWRTAADPVQVGKIVTIPDIDGVLYWDVIGREFVEGQIDLDTRQNKSINLTPAAKYQSYSLRNPDATWFFTSNLDVYSKRPIQRNNDITILETDGVEYINKATGKVLTGTFRILEDITIEAKATGQYILESIENEWTFKWTYIEPKRVNATKPTATKNWVTIPDITGIRYYNAVTGDTVRDTIYIRQNITIGVESVSEEYVLNNPEVTWLFEPVETGLKEIIIMDSDRRLVVHLNGEHVQGDVIAVEPGSMTNITLILGEDAEFAIPPYLVDLDDNRIDFEFVDGNYTAVLNIRFEDSMPLELYLGDIVNRSKPLFFQGENAYVEIKEQGVLVGTLYPGQSGALQIEGNYTFSIYPMEGYEFDRHGYLTDGTKTQRVEPVSRFQANAGIPFVNHPMYLTMSAVMLEDYRLSDAVGFNNIYITPMETLNLVSEQMLKMKRQFMINNEGGGLNYDSQLITNPHSYIINTIQIPFSVPMDFISTRERIMIGYTELFTSALKLNTDKIFLDLGTIYTKPKYNNTYDFANTTVNLHMPYANPITLDATYVVGQHIHLEYIVSAYTGRTTINVRSSMVDNNVIYTTEVSIANDIPFISMKDATVVGSPQESQPRINNNTPRPFLEVIRHKPYEKDSMFNNLTRTTVDALSELSGRVYVHQVALNMTKATLEEESQLRSILSSGIIIS